MDRSRGRVRTVYVILIRVVRAVCWARHKGCPECSADFALFQSRQVDVSVHSTFLKRLGKVFRIDVVVVQKSDQDC